jgi:hypothetical protein
LLASLSLTWVSARAAGFTAFGLLTASVALGLVLSSPLRSERWPRFATTELHRFVTLLTLVFIAVHVLVVLFDSFIGFSVAEVVVPFVSHYRPLWMGLGIVSAYLAAALWATNWLQHRIGYRWWRRLHYGTFAVYLGATAHGLGSGSDTSWAWSRAIYLLSLALVGGLLVVRLPTRNRAARPASPAAPSGRTAPAAGAAATTPDPAAMAAGAAADRPAVTMAPGGVEPGGGGPAAAPAPGVAATGAGGPPGFSARVRGRLWQGADGGGGSLVVLEGVLDAGFDGHFQLRVHGRTAPGSSRLEVIDNRVWVRGRDGTVWWGRIDAFDGKRLHGAIIGDRPGARPLALAIELFEIVGESVRGAMHATSAAPAASPLAS